MEGTTSYISWVDHDFLLKPILFDWFVDQYNQQLLTNNIRSQLYNFQTLRTGSKSSLE